MALFPSASMSISLVFSSRNGMDSALTRLCRLTKFSGMWLTLCARSILTDFKLQDSTWKSGKLTPLLRLIVSTVVHEVLEEASAHAREEIRQYCGMENHRPLTLNKEEYAKTKDENVTEFSIKRNGPDSLPKTNGALFILEDIQGRSFQFRATEEILLKVLSAYGIHLSSAKELVRIHVDVYQAELDVIAHVIAYFDIASKHLIDTMPKIFEKRFANQFGQKLADVLTTRLNLIGDGGLQTCSRYSRDEPHIQERRRELTRKQKILTKALKTVEDFHK